MTIALVRERDTIPHANGIFYAGVDRQRWADVFDEDYDAKRTPADIARLASALKKQDDDFSGLIVCRDLAVASTLLSYSNRSIKRNELIAVSSPSLNATKGTLDTDLMIEWIGYDIMAWGEWSLIADGMFIYPEHYSRWFNYINRFGLFDDLSLFSEYKAFYDNAVAAGKSEPLAPPSAGFETIAINIGRLQR